MPHSLEPFGALTCETEIKQLGSMKEYSKYYFHETRFNLASLDQKTYLIIGRRGSGKTALSNYFSFQKMVPNCRAIDVDEPDAFQRVMSRIATKEHYTREIAIPGLVKVWEYVLWSIIFRELQNEDVRIKGACAFNTEPGQVAAFIKNLLKALLVKYTDSDESLADELEKLLSSKAIQEAKEACLEVAQKIPVVVAIDTLENYGVKDQAMMNVMAALIKCAQMFNESYAPRNIHVKLFLMAEIFPFLKEDVVLNALKDIQRPIHLQWRPKELLKLICWRLWHHLKANDLLEFPNQDIDWSDHQDVLAKCWEPYFGKEIINGAGLTERTFPYVLRHTQMRPRQLILLCNLIAQVALDRGSFPRFPREAIVEGVRKGERDLADEVFNCYSSLYPKAARIAEALSGMPVIFKGNELDRRAPLSALHWNGEYSPDAFRQFVAELGIVGRVRKGSFDTQFVEADFEYSQESRLPLVMDDQCVIHPMFYRRLNIQMNQKLRVYPFPDHVSPELEWDKLSLIAPLKAPEPMSQPHISKRKPEKQR